MNGMDYDEFRVVLTPDPGGAGSWNATLADCPIPAECGAKGAVISTSGSTTSRDTPAGVFRHAVHR